jgi:hypothetical protein
MRRHRGTYKARSARKLRSELPLTYAQALAVRDANETLGLWRSRAADELRGRVLSLRGLDAPAMTRREEYLALALIETLARDFLPYAAGLGPYAKRFGKMLAVLARLGVGEDQRRELARAWNDGAPLFAEVTERGERTLAAAGQQVDSLSAGEPCEPEPLAALVLTTTAHVGALVAAIERISDALFVAIVEPSYSPKVDWVVAGTWQEMTSQVETMWHSTRRLEDDARSLTGAEDPAAADPASRLRIVHSRLDNERLDEAVPNRWKLLRDAGYR